METSVAGERGGALPGIARMVQIILGGTGCASSEWARPATVVLAGSRQEILRKRETVSEGKRGPRREPRAEEDSRLAGVPARRTCVAEIGRQSQPREARLKLRQPDFGPRAGALYQPRVNHASGSRRVGGGSGRG
jgi:hypothetical protein